MTGHLLSCPCGETPGRLIIHDGDCCKWAYCCGDCCGDWFIEFRTNYLDAGSDEIYARAVDAWNATPREKR